MSADGVHPSAVGPNPSFPNPSTQQSTDTGISNVATQGSHDDQTTTSLDSEYPEQKHAGKVGLGPEYGKKNKETHGMTAKIAGIKEEIKGAITRNHNLVQKGHDRRTGELAQKEEASKDNENPFEKEERAKQQQQDSISSADTQQQPPQPQNENINGPGNIGHTPSTDHAARAQAATTHPEGTEGAAKQVTEGTELQRDAQMHSVGNVST